jgi:protease-4
MTPWDDATRERVRMSMRRIYDLFVARVAEGRGLDKQAVYDTAEGAIFLAPTGKDRGLVDETGGLLRALEIARAEAHLPDDVPVVLEGASETLLESLLLGPEPDAGEVEAALLAYQRRLTRAALPFGDSQAVEMLRPFAAIVQPLLDGEQVVAALPVSLSVR